MMVDVVDKVTRSRMMSGIRGRDTKPELQVRRYLHAAGFRFRLSPRNVFGKPDIVLPKYRTVVFVHGCYWHRHEGCRFATTPTSNTEFWQEKFEANTRRDRKVVERLHTDGWNVQVVWECDLNEQRLQGLVRNIRGNA